MTDDERPPPRPRGPDPAPSRVPAPSGASVAERAPRDQRTEGIRLKERIYATITMIAVVAALAQDDEVDRADAASTVFGTALGVWLATLVADQQAHRVVHQRIARGDDLRTMLYTSSALLISAVGPLAFIALSALGAMSLHTALLVAVCAELAGLFAWGWLGGLRLGGGPIAAALAGAADLVIGAVIVAVKVAAGH